VAAAEEATAAEEREHVTMYFYKQPERFRLGQFTYRLTVDTPEDLELVQRIVERLYLQNPLFSWLDILRLLREQPEWIEHNTHIKQKRVAP
jgi:spore coat polysaccharide biosynthesis protein SpsF